MSKTRDMSDLISKDRLVYEYGSNANGEFIKYDNGVQKCWTTLTVPSLSITVAAGSFYRNGSGDFSWTFPAAFVDTSPKVIGVSGQAEAAVPDQTWFAYGIGQSSTEGRGYFFAVTSGTYDAKAFLLAIGRWY